MLFRYREIFFRYNEESGISLQGLRNQETKQDIQLLSLIQKHKTMLSSLSPYVKIDQMIQHVTLPCAPIKDSLHFILSFMAKRDGPAIWVIGFA